jgi:hypothetical protein
MPLNKTALAQSILKLMTDARKETEIDIVSSRTGWQTQLTLLSRRVRFRLESLFRPLVLLLLRQVLRLVQEKYCNDLLYL